jgi:DNA-binding NarL/FixJ family response regulator
MRPARLVLADDHALVLAGLRKLLEPEFEVVAAVEDGRALVEAVVRLRPDVVLLDISMPLLNGLEAARQLKERAPESKLIFVTMHADVDYVAEAMRAGASGYLLKRSAAGELVAAIRRVLDGGAYVTPLAHRASGVRGRSPGGLTARQREVLQLVAEGRSTKEIAAILRVSVKTVEFHRSALASRLGLRTTAELTRYALERGIISA